MDLDAATLMKLLARFRAGDGSAFGELVELVAPRLEKLVRRQMAGYPDVARWEQPEDVLQNTYRRLWTALRQVTPTSTRSFENFTAHLIQRELIDLARRYGGRQGLGANHESDAQDGPHSRLNAPAPSDPDLEFWTACHQAVAKLPNQLREVVALTLYAELPRSEIAACLGLSKRTVKRRLAEAVERLRTVLGDRWALTNDSTPREG